MECFSFSNFIINKKNLINNVNKVRGCLSPSVRLCAVVKANAYGVGVKQVSSVIEPLVDCFAVANLKEGIELRETGITKEIITLSPIKMEQKNIYAEYFLTPPVSTFDEVNKLSSELKLPLKVNFALNSGMNRIGFTSLGEIWASISKILSNNKIKIFGAFSHLATKENDCRFMYTQKEKFDYLLTPFDGLNIVKHLANTNATFNHFDLHYDMVRVGFGLYGMTLNEFGLKPVVSIDSRVVLISDVYAGESVGYDRTFIAPSDRKIAVVPLGYYDGINRGLSNCGKVIINGEFAPIVGRICMDSMMVDVSHIKNVEVGSKVTIIGSQENAKIDVSEHAKLVGTSEYEILSRFNSTRMNVII